MLTRWILKIIRRAVLPYFIALAKELNKMATKQDLANVVDALKATEPSVVAGLRAQVADLQAQLAASQSAADTVDDSVITDIQGVINDLNPPAPVVPPATDTTIPERPATT